MDTLETFDSQLAFGSGQQCFHEATRRRAPSMELDTTGVLSGLLGRGHSTAIQAGGAGKDCLSSGPRPWSPFSTMLFFPTSLPAFAPAHPQSPHTQGLGPF